MTPQQVNKIIGYVFIGAIALVAVIGVVDAIQTGSFNQKYIDIITTLGVSLIAFRHKNDIEAGNGASGVTPPTPKQ